MAHFSQADLNHLEEHAPKALAKMLATPCPRLRCNAHVHYQGLCTTPGGANYGFHRERQNAAGVVDRLGNYLPEYVG